MNIATTRHLVRIAICFGAIICGSQSFAQLNILGITPTPNANNVARNSNVVMTFDQNIDALTLNSSTIVVRGHLSGVVSGVLSGGGGTTVTFNPDSDFRLGEVLSITITTSLMSESPASSLAFGHTYSFTALSGAPPTIPLMTTQRNVARISQMEDIKVRDFDRDGDLDILTASEGIPETTLFWENDGNQRFCAIGTPARFRNVEVFDIDGDGFFDGFGVPQGGFNVDLTWHQNDGTNTNFTEILISSADPWTATGGDLDSDGDIDVVAAVIIPTRLFWWPNDGSGGFPLSGTQITTTMTGGSNSFFYIVDINTDGAMDILAYHEDDFNMVWYQNDGSQNFTEILIANTSGTRQRLAYADMEGDGDLDIVRTATQSPAAISWYENDGSENFTERAVTIIAPNQHEGIEVTDFDGDMDMDLVAGAYWYENDGSQNFTEHLSSPGLKAGPNFFALAVDYGDMDNDGDMDLVSAGGSWLAWQENGEFMNITATSPSNSEFGVVADANITINFDQPVDNATVNSANISVFSSLTGTVSGIFSGGGTNAITFDPTTNFQPGERIEVSINDKVLSTGGFSLATNYGIRFDVATTAVNQPQFTSNSVLVHSTNLSGLDIADVDNDGDMDLLTCTFSELFWHENDGAGNFSSIPIATTLTPTGIFAIDQNGDGHMEILVDANGSGSVIYDNDGAENFTEGSIVAPSDIQQIVDFTLDGNSDLVAINSSDQLFLSGYRCGFYVSYAVIPTNNSRGARAADMDGDGDTDVIAAATVGSTWYRNDGFLNFTSISIDANSTINLDLADVDGDGDMDPIYVENFSAIIWYPNQLNEASNDFGARQVIGVLDMDPRSVYAADFDGDGDMDITALSRNDDKVVWYENRLNEASNDFGPEQLLPGVADGGIQIAAADIDGDGDMDIVSISDQDDELIWFQNNSGTAAALTFTQQPQAVAVCDGGNTTFTVAATGDTGLSYQWQEESGSGFVNLADGGIYSNTTAATLDIIGVTAAVNGFSYRCQVTGATAPTVTSNAAVLTIDDVPAITTQPQSVNATTGDNVTFTVAATSALALSYTWAKDGTNISSATSASFSISSVALTDAGDYISTVTNICGNVVSTAATLSVQDPPVSGSNIVVYNAISPNGDGKHDFLEIENITQHASNEVLIFNRWGDLVFEISGYDNANSSFSGRSNQGSESDLPAGTYYYSINLNDGTEQITGFLVLSR